MSMENDLMDFINKDRSVDELVNSDDEEGSGEEEESSREDVQMIEEEEEEMSESISKQKEQITPKRLPTEFLLCTTKHHIYLLNSNLKILDRLFFNPFSMILPSWFKGLSRLSLIEYIPELSLALIASQSDSKIALIR